MKPTGYEFYEPPFSIEDIYSPVLKEEKFETVQPYGKCNVMQWYFDGIRIVHTRHHYSGHFLFEKDNSLDVVGLEFNLKGHFVIHHHGNIYKTKGHQHNIIYTPGINNTFQNGHLVAESFKIQFAPEIFLKLTEDSNDILKRFGDKIPSRQPIVLAKDSLLLTPALHKAILDIIGCKFSGGLKKMFLLSKAMEILVMQAEAFDKANRKPRNEARKKIAQEQIIYAKEYLLQNMENPPNLIELSKIAGINEYKLKKGFKEIFNTTIFNYLSDARLEKAHQALLEKAHSVSEIAYDLGYSSPQHFSKAFKKKFGVPPKTLQ